MNEDKRKLLPAFLAMIGIVLYLPLGVYSSANCEAAISAGSIELRLERYEWKEVITEQAERAIKPGNWGSAGVGVSVEKKRATFEFDCAEGEIRKPLTVDRRGNFHADGTYTQLSHGPIRMNNLPRAQPAKYDGKVSGKTMTFRITLTETDEVVGEFTVERDKVPRIRKCR
jgi:hypothetical protein